MYQDRLGHLSQLHLPPAPNSSPDYFDVYQNYEIDDLYDFLTVEAIMKKEWNL